MADYGVGIDCHSRFIQVCILVKSDANILRFDREYTTDWKDLCEAREWVCSVLASNLADRFEGRVLAYTLESTGCYHLPVVHAFGGNPSVVVSFLANPSRRKTDKLDDGCWPTMPSSACGQRATFAATDIQCGRIAIMYRSRVVNERTRIYNSLNNVVLRFGHTFGAFTRPSTATGWSILEDLADGKLPNMKGVSPIPIPEDVRPMMKSLMTRATAINGLVKEANAAMLGTVKKAEFTTGGGEIVTGAFLLPEVYDRTWGWRDDCVRIPHGGWPGHAFQQWKEIRRIHRQRPERQSECGKGHVARSSKGQLQAPPGPQEGG